MVLWCLITAFKSQNWFSVNLIWNNFLRTLEKFVDTSQLQLLLSPFFKKKNGSKMATAAVKKNKRTNAGKNNTGKNQQPPWKQFSYILWADSITSKQKHIFKCILRLDSWNSLLIISQDWITLNILACTHIGTDVAMKTKVNKQNQADLPCRNDSFWCTGSS